MTQTYIPLDTFLLFYDFPFYSLTSERAGGAGCAAHGCLKFYNLLNSVLAPFWHWITAACVRNESNGVFPVG